MDKREMLKKRIYKIKSQNIKRKALQEDLEPRRSTRVGAVIAISAIVGTVCVVLFQLSLYAVDIFPKEGLAYGYAIALYCFVLATALITVWDIVSYVIADLKRYNVIERGYSSFDELSDKKYMILIEGFKRHMMFYAGAALIIIPLSAIYGNLKDVWPDMIVTVEMLILGVFFFYKWWKKAKYDERWHGIKNIFLSLLKCVGTMVLCYLFMVAMAINSESILEIRYSESGQVDILHESLESYEELKITIKNNENIVMYEDVVNRKELLWAQEDEYVQNIIGGEKIDEGIVVSGARLYWRYIFDLDKIIENDGGYMITITVKGDEKYVVIQNTFIVNNQKYIFAKENIEKDY